MIGTCGEFSKTGRLITTRGARTPAWGQAYLNHRKAFRCWKFQVTEFRVVNKWQGTLSWAVCITNIDWKKWRHENQAKTMRFLRSTGIEAQVCFLPDPKKNHAHMPVLVVALP